MNVMKLPSVLCFACCLVCQAVAIEKFPSKENLAEERNQFEAAQECGWLESANKQTTSCSSYLANGKPPLVVIAVDGFRPEYLHRSSMDGKGLAAPTLSCLLQNGIRVPFMVPSAPTKTSPSLYTIVTGLYPESHGIVKNSFYDPDFKEYFRGASPESQADIKWWKGEPIWATAKKQGRISASYHWVGTGVVDERHSPTYHNESISRSFANRIQQVLDFLDMPVKERPNIITTYFHEPDSRGHVAGPNSRNTTNEVQNLDKLIRRMADTLIRKKIWGCVNLIIVSDHGMAHRTPEQIVVLSEHVKDLYKTTIMNLDGIPAIRPKTDTPAETERIRKGLECKDEHMRVWTKWEFPYRMHHYQSNRIPSLLIDVDYGYFTHDKRPTNLPMYAGAHGEDYLYEDVRSIFVAHGPSFKKRFTASPIDSVELYNLMCALIDVKPAKNNGTWGALHHLLVDPPETGSIGARLAFENKMVRSEGSIESLKQTPAKLVEGESIGMNALVHTDHVEGIDSRVLPVWQAYTLTAEAAGVTPDVAWLGPSRMDVPVGMLDLVETMTRLLKETRDRLKRNINVVTGRIYDRYPALYYTVSTCLSRTDGDVTKCPMKDRDVQVFVLPTQTSYRGNCLRNRKYIAYHVATLKDVEQLTGLRFFPRIPAKEKLEMLSWTVLQSRLVLDPTRIPGKNFNEF